MARCPRMPLYHFAALSTMNCIMAIHNNIQINLTSMTMEFLCNHTMAYNIQTNLLMELLNLIIHIFHITNLHRNNMLSIMGHRVLLLPILQASSSTSGLSGYSRPWTWLDQSYTELCALTTSSVWLIFHQSSFFGPNFTMEASNMSLFPQF